jgi:hypothetical protein
VSEINLFFTVESQLADQAALLHDFGASLTTLRTNLTQLAASAKSKKNNKREAKVDSNSAAAKAGDESIMDLAAGSSDESAVSDEEADQAARKTRKYNPPARQTTTPGGMMKQPTLQEQQAFITEVNQALAQTIMAGRGNLLLRQLAPSPRRCSGHQARRPHE